VENRSYTDRKARQQHRRRRFDPEPFQRAVGHIPASHQVEIGAVRGIEAERIVEVEEPTASLDERGHRALLFGRNLHERDPARRG
jgi:hypothetical protein